MSIRCTLQGIALLVVASVLAATQVKADNISGAVGVTRQDGFTGRVGFVRDWETRWWESDRGHLTGYWDAAYTYWEGSDETGGAHSLSFSPVFVYQFYGERLQPFVEFGIGVSLFSSEDVGERDLGSSFNFEDRIGVGLTLSNGSRIGLRAIHYSNADIEHPNEGIESFALFYTWSY